MSKRNGQRKKGPGAVGRRHRLQRKRIPGQEGPPLREKTELPRFGWQTVASLGALIFTFFGLCFGMLSVYFQMKTNFLQAQGAAVERQNAALAQTLEQRRLLAEDRERDGTRKAHELAMARDILQTQMANRERAFGERERAFTARVKELLQANESERGRLGALMAESRESGAQAAAQLAQLKVERGRLGAILAEWRESEVLSWTTDLWTPADFSVFAASVHACPKYTPAPSFTDVGFPPMLH